MAPQNYGNLESIFIMNRRMAKWELLIGDSENKTRINETVIYAFNR